MALRGAAHGAEKESGWVSAERVARKMERPWGGCDSEAAARARVAQRGRGSGVRGLRRRQWRRGGASEGRAPAQSAAAAAAAAAVGSGACFSRASRRARAQLPSPARRRLVGTLSAHAHAGREANALRKC
jgi:hypothetical protein